MNLKYLIENLKDKEDELSKLKLDIIRVLAIFNGVLWKSELIPDIVKVHGYVIDYIPSEDSIENALKELEKEGLVSIEERERGSAFSAKKYKDKLVKLLNLREVKTILMSDNIYREYMIRKIEMLRQALKES